MTDGPTPPAIVTPPALVIDTVGPERRTLDVWASDVRTVNEENGWFESDRSFGEDMALIHSEVSEALEAFREYGAEDSDYAVTHHLCAGRHFSGNHTLHDLDVRRGGHLCKPEGIGSELADVIIRVLDTVSRYDIDIADAMESKIRYNRTRGHRHGGKNL